MRVRTSHQQQASPAAYTRPEFDLRVSQDICQAAVAAFGKGEDSKTVYHAIEEIARLADQITAAYIETDPPPSPVHCRAGCAHCCHVRVHVTAPEVLLIARYIDAVFPESEVDALKIRLQQSDEATRGLSDEARGRAGIRCPLLVDETCSVYPARPLECRGYVSMDVAACEAASKNYDAWNVPLYFAQYSIFKNAQVGFLWALVQRGRDAELLELIAALRIALDNPDAAEDWLAGKNVFSAAALPDSDPEMLSLRPWTPTFGAYGQVSYEEHKSDD